MKKFFIIFPFLLSLIVTNALAHSAIVVIGCGILGNKSTSRVLKAIDECSFESNYIIFSGRGRNEISEAEFLRNLYFTYNTKCLAIPLLEENSYTTISNSLSVMTLFREKSITSATIVTSKNHFYAPIIFNTAKILKNIHVTLDFSYSEYTNND